MKKILITFLVTLGFLNAGLTPEQAVQVIGFNPVQALVKGAEIKKLTISLRQAQNTEYKTCKSLTPYAKMYSEYVALTSTLLFETKQLQKMSPEEIDAVVQEWNYIYNDLSDKAYRNCDNQGLNDYVYKYTSEIAEIPYLFEQYAQKLRTQKAKEYINGAKKGAKAFWDALVE